MKISKRNILLLSVCFATTLSVSANKDANTAVEKEAQPLMSQPVNDVEVNGTVTDSNGEPLVGVSVVVKGSSQGVITDIDGKYSIKVAKGKSLVFSYVGYQSQTLSVKNGTLNVTMKDDAKMLEGVVVTAMGIVRKETSLTYATQQVKADDLMKVEDPNLVNSLDGKIAGVTITPGAGGAGGASKILLRGNKSIQGNNSPLIVVDGIPMSNSTRGSAANFATQSSTEGSDPLSQINPDDIESINVLKGANAAALYGSQAANGVIMITTKKGKEGKLDISYTGNVTCDTPLLTPEIQNVYGIGLNSTGTAFDGLGSWGPKLSGQNTTYTLNLQNSDRVAGDYSEVHMRNYAEDDVSNFYRTGVTTNNSVSLSGGTEKVRGYVSYANSHSTGMLENNSYNRHTFAYRQHFKFWDKQKWVVFKSATLDASANYVQTTTKNRVGGGTALNPIYDLYTMPRNIDLNYYRNNYLRQGTWVTTPMTYWPEGSSTYITESARLSGNNMQNWAFQNAMKNNPYFLMNQNTGEQKEARFYGNFQLHVDIWDGLSAQARVSIDHTKYNSESQKSATTWDPADMNFYGRYWLSNIRTNEIYEDFMLMYNKTFNEDWMVNANVGYVGHTIKSYTTSTDVTATVYDRGSQASRILSLPTRYNIFEPSAGDNGTSKSESSNWDQAALVTAQAGWKDAIYADFSYRMDWYRAFKQARFQSGNNKAKDHYGYWGGGVSFIPTNLFKMPKQISYLKYRISYSEVGNSIPNTVFDVVTTNLAKDASSGSNYNSFTPKPETMKSFETGIESQFFNNALNFDITYYNSTLDGAYLTVSGQNGKTQPVNSTRIRNQGVEITLGYDWMFAKNWRWKTSVNFSFNDNKILEVYTDEQGNEKFYDVNVAQGVHVRYKKDGKYGDMYVTDFNRWASDCTDANGHYHKAGDIYINPTTGLPTFGGKTISMVNGKQVESDGETYSKYIGNVNSKYQLSWSNTFSWKNFNLYFLISGRFGGKVISMTEAYLDRLGLSQRTADARLEAEEKGIVFNPENRYWSCPQEGAGEAGMYINEGRDIVPIKEYYEALGTNDAQSYVYDATNFRLRELSFGYTFRNLFGENKNLSLSFIGRNLFFLYKKAPVDPDVSLSTSNSLGGFECFNLPSSRSFGFNVKVNF